MGHLLGESIRDVMRALAAHGGARDALRPGHGPRRHRDPERGREAAARAGPQPRSSSGARASSREVWAWKEQYGGLILKQLRRLGTSPDWTRERFTLDDALLARGAARVPAASTRRASIYRGRYIVNWCPRCQTALSDEEVEHVEIEGPLWYITLSDQGHREVHHRGDHAPRDDARRHRRGGAPQGPPLRAPASARPRCCRWCGARSRSSPTRWWTPSSAPGAVKITPAHDPNDFQIGERHGLPDVVVMDERGVMNEQRRRLPRASTASRRASASSRRCATPGYLERVEPHARSVGHCSRCDTIIEPYLSRQWFVKMAPLAAPAIEAAQQGPGEVLPGALEEGVPPLAREHPRLVHLAAAVVGASHPGVVPRRRDGGVARAARKARAGRQDEDVLDTWFSSWLWPFATLGWPEETEDLEALLPEQPDGDRQRHHLLLGGAHDHGRDRVHGRSRRSRTCYFTSIVRDARGAEDVEVARQLARPARDDGRATAPTRCASR